MTDKYFNFSDVLGYGWDVMKGNFWFFVGIAFIWLGIAYIPAMIDMTAYFLKLPEPFYGLVSFGTSILSWIINIILAIGLIKIALSFCDEYRPKIGMLFDAWDCFWRYLGAAILYVLIVFSGFILFIFPGIIWSIKFGLCFYFVVDEGLGPIEALKASSRTTMDVKWHLFGFGVLCALIIFLGALCLLVGLFAVYPMVLVAKALVYRQLLAQTPELAEFGIETQLFQEEAELLPDE